MKIFIGLLLVLGITQYSSADSVVEEENFDRLFTNKSERRELDLARQQGRLTAQKNPDDPSAVVGDEKAVIKPTPLKMSGIILRADGKAQVWVSGKPLYSSLKTVDADKKTSANVRIPLAGKNLLLKPGQVLSNGKAKEAYYFVTSSAASSVVSVVVENQQSSITAIINTGSSQSAASSVASQVNDNAQSSAR